MGGSGAPNSQNAALLQQIQAGKELRNTTTSTPPGSPKSGPPPSPQPQNDLMEALRQKIQSRRPGLQHPDDDSDDEDRAERQVWDLLSFLN
jgi:hypothetical protein